MTAVEAFDLRFLINEDYGLCACVGPDYGSDTRRHGASKRVANKQPYSKERCSAQPCLDASDHMSEREREYEASVEIFATP